jgi:hypothetical protein
LEIVLLLVFFLGYFVLIYRARKYFILHKSTDDDAMFMAPEKSASKQEQLSHYSMEIRIRYIGYILLSFMIFGYAHYQSKLNEYFSIYHVDISLSYLGYWMTILMLPILGILDYFWLLNKVKHLTP